MDIPSCFKAYDIRGRVPEELDETLARRIGIAFAKVFTPRRVVIGRDVRPSSPALAAALAQGFTAMGVEVLDLGLCGTEEVYFAAATLGVEGGIMVTASHNPADHNGMKLVQGGAVPVSGDSGLHEIGRLVAGGVEADTTAPSGRVQEVDNRQAYVDHLLSWVAGRELAPLTIVVNPGNGCAGPVLDRLEPHLPFRFIKIHYPPDGSFPHGVPNPLLPENRSATSEAVRRHRAGLGLAWDGDFDRCFFFDEHGDFVEGYYLVGLLARAVLAREPGARIIHDPRLVWNTQEVVAAAGGVAVQSKTGHAFIKERMRAEDAAYGGEMSAHHYFRDFFYCDSGMIPWLLVADQLSTTGRPLSDLVAEFRHRYPVSGEINRKVGDPPALLARVEERYGPRGTVDHTDGLSVATADYRFNLRCSNTEPLVRLNVESRGDTALMERITADLLAMIDEEG